jgi:hypothetical protein
MHDAFPEFETIKNRLDISDHSAEYSFRQRQKENIIG